MSETDSVPLPVDEPGPATDWQAFPSAAASVAMIVGTMVGAIVGVALAVFVAWPLAVAWPTLSLAMTLLLIALVLLLSLAAGMWLGYRRWKFAQWKLDAIGLHARRGRLWRREILIPRSRVQHLDLERGPIERHFGLATLVVHTAGTRLHALRQSGFADADAVALRDALVPDPARHDDVL